VTSKFDIARAADLMLAQHGRAATLAAAQRADELLERGDLAGAKAWRRVFKAIELLQRASRGKQRPN